MLFDLQKSIVSDVVKTEIQVFWISSQYKFKLLKNIILFVYFLNLKILAVMWCFPIASKDGILGVKFQFQF